MATKSDQDIGEQLLKLLAERSSVDSYQLSQELQKEHQLIVGAIKSLQSLGNVSTQTQRNSTVSNCMYH